MTQAKSRPPGFVVMCSHPDKMPDSYYALSGSTACAKISTCPARPSGWCMRGQGDKNPYKGKRAKKQPSKLTKAPQGAPQLLTLAPCAAYRPCVLRTARRGAGTGSRLARCPREPGPDGRRCPARRRSDDGREPPRFAPGRQVLSSSNLTAVWRQHGVTLRDICCAAKPLSVGHWLNFLKS